MKQGPDYVYANTQKFKSSILIIHAKSIFMTIPFDI